MAGKKKIIDDFLWGILYNERNKRERKMGFMEQSHAGMREIMKRKRCGIVFLAILLLICCGCGQKEEMGRTEDMEKSVLQENRVSSAGKEGNQAVDTIGKIRMDEEAPVGSGEEDMPKDAFCLDTADFAVHLLKENLEENKGENVMVSPASALTALAMTANGAKGDTLSQMLSVLARNQDMDSLNENLKAWTDGLTDTEGASLKMANAIWIQDEGRKLTVEKNFLEKNAGYYHADIYQAPFCEETLNDINSWAEEKTDGRIKRILGNLQEDAVMYLVNAVVFDGSWEKAYEPYQVREDVFFNGKKGKETVPFMYSEESVYIKDEKAAGFIKPYKEGYRFAALLPDEGISPEEYIGSMDGEHFLALLAGAETEVTVKTGMPKFEADYETELSGILAEMGMKDAFDWRKADFRGIGVLPGVPVCLSRVIHKTYISVKELGTEAAAATVEEMVAGGARQEPAAKVYEVYLQRPFVYAIVEEESNLPVFIGVLNQVKTK